jgi:ribosome-associated heat shock protein Hsp15
VAPWAIPPIPVVLDSGKTFAAYSFRIDAGSHKILTIVEGREKSYEDQSPGESFTTTFVVQPHLNFSCVSEKIRVSWKLSGKLKGVGQEFRSILPMEKNAEIVRLDKWLWAARFFKTRSLATQAVNGGKVHVNGSRSKAAHSVVIGDTLIISIGTMEFHVEVLAISRFRRPAAEARLLYAETAESIAVREEQREMKKMIGAGFSAPAQKPGKRDRRKIRSFTRKE